MISILKVRCGAYAMVFMFITLDINSVVGRGKLLVTSDAKSLQNEQSDI